MTYLIRECTEKDAEAIWKLNCSEMGYDYPLRETITRIRKVLRSGSDKVYVAVTEERVVGYIHASDYDLLYSPHMKNIMGIAVALEYKNNGIGRSLLARVEDWARQTGATAVRLVSGTQRVEAHAFYERCGYSGGKKQVNYKKTL